MKQLKPMRIMRTDEKVENDKNDETVETGKGGENNKTGGNDETA